MKVELSERSRQVVERLVADGTYPNTETAVEAAIEALRDEWDDLDATLLAEQARSTRADGTFREATDAYLAEVRARGAAIINAKPSA